MFDRNPPQSEITPAPLSPPPSATSYPPDKKSTTTHAVDTDPSRTEMGMSPVDDTDSGFGSNPKNHNDGVVVDAVWGRIDENGPNYRNLGW